MSNDLQSVLTQGSDTARDQIRALLAAKRACRWRGLPAIPPGSLLEGIVDRFRLATDIPLETPFFSFLSILAAALLNRNVIVRVADATVHPDLWTVILAPSGTGKTYAQKRMVGAFGCPELEWDATGIASTAKFIQDLEANNRRLWVRDEFGQLLRAVNSPGPMAEMRDTLLRLYSGDTITRETRQYKVRVDDPHLVILGLTVDETFLDQVSVESILDGFAQRFLYVYAQRDPARPMEKYPIYDLGNGPREWAGAWQTLLDGLQPEYVATPGALDAFRTAFAELLREGLPGSFYRRILWTAHKYALVYHVLRGLGPNPALTAEDYGWAARVLQIHLDDAARLLENHGLSELEQYIRSAEKVVERFRAKGLEAKPRDILAGVRQIRNVSVARFVLEHVRSMQQSKADTTLAG